MTQVNRGLSLGEGCPRFVLKVRSSVFLGFLLSNALFRCISSPGEELPIKTSVFHSKTYSLLGTPCFNCLCATMPNVLRGLLRSASEL